MNDNYHLSNNNAGVPISHAHSLCPPTKTYPASAARLDSSKVILYFVSLTKAVPLLEVGIDSAVLEVLSFITVEVIYLPGLVKTDKLSIQSFKLAFEFCVLSMALYVQQKLF